MGDGYDLQVRQENATTTLQVRGRIDLGNAQRLLDDALHHLNGSGRNVALDLSGVEYFDSAGGVFVLGLRQQVTSRGGDLRIVAATPAIEGFLGLVDQEAVLHPKLPAPPKHETLTLRVGSATLEVWAAAREFVVFTGEVILGLLAVLRRPALIRARETWLYMQRTGLDALPIVALISFLMGLITAFQAAVQLTQFGADIYIANLVGLSIVRELGPLMTAIIAAGRSGAAFAAEIGTMKVSEEVDALTTMGFDRTRFLVTPKVIALLCMLPCLTLFADLLGILGGLAVAVADLHMPAQVYVRQLGIAMRFGDVATGLVKSVAFAAMIAGVGCLYGFRVRGGAESVGRMTTSAIVAGIFMIIVIDAVFTVLFYFW